MNEDDKPWVELARKFCGEANIWPQATDQTAKIIEKVCRGYAERRTAEVEQKLNEAQHRHARQMLGLSAEVDALTRERDEAWENLKQLVEEARKLKLVVSEIRTEVEDIARIMLGRKET